MERDHFPCDGKMKRCVDSWCNGVVDCNDYMDERECSSANSFPSDFDSLDETCAKAAEDFPEMEKLITDLETKCLSEEIFDRLLIDQLFCVVFLASKLNMDFEELRTEYYNSEYYNNHSSMKQVWWHNNRSMKTSLLVS